MLPGRSRPAPGAREPAAGPLGVAAPPPRPTRTTASARFRLRPAARERLLGYRHLRPTIVVMGLVIVYPVFRGVLISFQSFRLTRPGEIDFIGFGNYAAVFGDPVVWTAASNTAVWTVSNVVVQIILGTALALLLNERLAGRGLFRSTMLIPWIVPSVAAALIWRWMYDGSAGIVNAVFYRLGIIDDYVAWLGNVGTAMPAVILESIWKGTPFVLIMILAGLQALPGDLYEAAALDGASALHRLRTITLPLLRPTLAIATILTTVGTVNNFNAIWLMTQGGPLHSTEILFTLAYKFAFAEFNFGVAAATSVILFLLLMLPAGLYLFLVERGEDFF